MADERKGYARELSEFRQMLELQFAVGERWIYPHEVREELRRIGVAVDKALPQVPDVTFDFEQHQPDFEPDQRAEELEEEAAFNVAE